MSEYQLRDTVTVKDRPGVWLVCEVTGQGNRRLQRIDNPADLLIVGPLELADLSPVVNPYTVEDLTARDFTPGIVVDLGGPLFAFLGEVDSVEHLPFPNGVRHRDRVCVQWRHNLPENGAPSIHRGNQGFTVYRADS